MKVTVTVRDNEADRNVNLTGEIPEEDVEFLNRAGERIAQGTDWEIILVAVESRS